jgi:hypothetical protein
MAAVLRARGPDLPYRQLHSPRKLGIALAWLQSFSIAGLPDPRVNTAPQHALAIFEERADRPILRPWPWSIKIESAVGALIGAV